MQTIMSCVLHAGLTGKLRQSLDLLHDNFFVFLFLSEYWIAG